jgi:hypothetical protein
MRENRLSKWLGEHLVNERRKTRERLLADEKKRLEEHEKNLEEKTPATILREKKEMDALKIDFENEFGYVSDARIDDLARTFEHWELEKKYKHIDLNFTMYVKMVTSGRWKEFVNDDDRPPTTILLKHRTRRVYVEHSKQTPPFTTGSLIIVFMILICILFAVFVFTN